MHAISKSRMKTAVRSMNLDRTSLYSASPTMAHARAVRKNALGLLSIAALVLAGCKSSSTAPYVSPKLTGRVIDAQTQQPLKGVTVKRLIPDQQRKALDDVKGGQVLAKAPAVRTKTDGTFELASERSLSLFQSGGWYSVSLAFDYPGYLRFATNYTLRDSILTPKGEPLVQTGDVPIQKISP